MNTSTLSRIPISVTNDSFGTDVLAASEQQPVLIDFWASWCGPCKAIAPIIEQIAHERSSRAVVAKIDVDAHPEPAARYGIRSIPTLLIFRDRQVVATMVGVRSKAEILERLDAALATPRASVPA